MPTTDKRPLKVFLCHAHSDAAAVRALYNRLTKDGVDAWLDKAKLLPGQDWELEIRKAVREADVVVVCLSKQFNQAGFRQKEVRLALDTAMEKPEGEIFIIPARLEECDTLESLRKWHWVDLFEDDGYEMLMRALRTRADRIGATLQIKRNWLPKATTSPVKGEKVAVIKKSEEVKKKTSLFKSLPKDSEKETPVLATHSKQIAESKKSNKPARNLRTLSLVAVFSVSVIIVVVFINFVPKFFKPISLPTATLFLASSLPPTLTSTATTVSPDETSLASALPTEFFTPTATLFQTATFEPHIIDWGNGQFTLGQSISLENAGRLTELAKLQVGLQDYYLGPRETIAVSDDNKLFFYELGAVVYIRRVVDGSIVRTLQHTNHVDCFDVSSDGIFLASISGNNELRVWRVDDGFLIRTINSQQTRYDECPITFSPDGSLLAIEGVGGISIMQVSDGTLLKVLNYQGDSTAYYSMSIFSSKGTFLVGNSNGKTYVWSVDDGIVVHSFQDGSYWSAFSPDDSMLAFVKDGGISIWRVSDWSLIETIKDSTSPNLEPSSPIFFLPNGQILVTGLFVMNSGTKAFRLWSVSDGVPIQDVTLNEQIDGLRVSNDGVFIVSLSYRDDFNMANRNYIRLWGISQ